MYRIPTFARRHRRLLMWRTQRLRLFNVRLILLWFCPHTDLDSCSFLWADPTKNALQVFLPQSTVVVNNNDDTKSLNTKDETLEEGVWISADPIPGCVVCNIGEMWEIWTNGLYRSTLHRVIHRGQNFRYVLAFDSLSNG